MIGKSIAHYEILELLGKGGMGEVYKARDTKLDRFVALKFLPPDQKLSREAKLRFTREAQAASALDHANICTIHEISETEGGDIYIVMAHYEGRTLDRILQAGALSTEQASDLARQLASALERAHESGISHRDLKPGNIMLTDRGELKLLDFGLAKLSSATQLTQAGTTMGTLDYMSPEQADARESDQRSDLWSFGVVLYQMLSGALPFHSESAAATLRAIVEKKPRSLPDELPQSLTDIVMACLQKDPDARPTAAAIRAALTPAQSDAAGTVVVRPRRPAKRNLLLAAAVLVLAAAAYWLLGHGGGAPKFDAKLLDPNRIAVTPFDVQGAGEFSYLGEGLVDMISAKLGGMANLKAANPRAVIAAARQIDDDASSPQIASEIARRNGAGRYISGSVLQIGDRVQIAAYLGDSGDPTAEGPQVQHDGDAEELLAIIDHVVGELLTESMGLADDDLTALAAATTSSLSALKEYLEGERAMRVGLYREAAAAYDRAVAADSTFALAFYRKSLAADWTDAPDIRIAADRAFALSDRLRQPERDLVLALRERRHGKSEEAQKIYRSVLYQFPDHVEALVQLGEALFHEGPRVGRPIMDSMQPFRRAAQLEPNNLIAQIHLSRLYAIEDSLEAVERIADHLMEIAPESPRAIEVEALGAYLSGEPGRIARLKEHLGGKPAHYYWYAAHGVLRFARDTEGAADLVQLHRGAWPLLRFAEQCVHIVRGKMDAYRAFIDSPERRDDPNWNLVHIFILTSGTVPQDATRLERLVERVREAPPAEILRTTWLPPYPDLTPRFLEFERDYFVALALIQLGRVEDARPVLERLAAEAPFEGLGHVNSDAVATLRAELRVRDGDTRGALDILRGVHCDIPHIATSRPIADAGRARLLRAELELQIGDVETAKNYYIAFDESWSPWDTLQRPLAYRRLGEIAEDAGELEAALLWYGRLLELWKDCDPEFVATREEIRGRHDALRRRSLP